MREADRSMPEDFGIDLARMMENAGQNLAGLAQVLFTPRTVIVLAGPGGNGGGGLAAARHLHNRRVTSAWCWRAGRWLQSPHSRPAS